MPGPTPDLNGDGTITIWENNMYNQYINFDYNGDGMSNIGEADQNFAVLQDFAQSLSQLSPQ